jgi:hypothetical protein
MFNYKTLAYSIPFDGGNHNYRLVVKESESGNQSIWVERNFNKGLEWDGVPSGWLAENVKFMPTLCIDYGQNWNVYPTKDAWMSISNYIK